MKGHADSASLITGVTRGLGEAARKDNAAAALLSGVVAFEDRFGRGDSSYVGLSEADIDRLAKYAQSISREDAELDQEAEEEGRAAWGGSDESSRQPEEPRRRASFDGSQTPRKPPHDPFGLLGSK